MSEIKVLSFAKINLAIDVGEVKNGFHEVDMVMHQLSFHDDVTVSYEPFPKAKGFGEANKDEESGSFDVKVQTNRYYLPVDERNLAHKAALLMAEKAKAKVPPGSIRVKIHKRIPVAGGLAGGSGNGAAVIHALNAIWDLGLSLKEIMDLSGELGSDCPFCAMGQAKANRNLPSKVGKDPLASSCARAKGRGDILTPVKPIESWAVIAKPRFSVSTAEVYKGIDKIKISERPDIDGLVRSLDSGAPAYDGFVNVLEAYTLKAYPEVGKLKDLMRGSGSDVALMSGSGPTVFGLFGDMESAVKASDKMREAGYESYWTRTTV